MVDGVLILRAKTLVVIDADSTAGGFADIDAFHLAELFVEELLPFHIVRVFIKQGLEMLLENIAKLLSILKFQVLP